MYQTVIKRGLDIFFACFALAVLAVPMLIIAIVVRITMGGPILFGQPRIGKDNKEFKMLKFRSMTDERDSQGVLLSDDDRMTGFGKFIRNTSLDELPELFNILKGDMSIIGPRPLLVRYLPRYTETQRRRHEVRPGLSCPSIIAGRNANTWEAQFEGDVWYVDHVGFWTDVKCVLNTIKIVLTHRGATAADGSCRGEFIGTASLEDVVSSAGGDHVKITQG